MLTPSQRRWTLLAIGLAQILDSADCALLPSVLKAMEETLAIDPSTLALFALAQTLCGALSAPFWGRLADSHNRVQLLAVAMCLWAVATSGVGFSSSVMWITLSRALNGIALACIGPLNASLTADLYPPHQRGRAFGALAAIGGVGRVVGATLSTSLSHSTILGLAGWRVSFLFISVMSVFGAWVVNAVASEPPRGAADGVPSESSLSLQERSPPQKQKPDHAVSTRHSHKPIPLKAAIGVIFKTKTFLVIVLQGMWGSPPWSAFTFLTMWLQYEGFPDITAAGIRAAFTVGHLFGALLGGALGDYVARFYPDHGRILIAQVADLGRLPLVLILFHVLPQLSAGWRMYAFVLFVLGLISPWVSVAANKPILAEVVSPQLRGQLFAYQRAIEGTSAALFGAPLVGWLSTHVFGYRKWESIPGLALDEMAKASHDSANAAALASAMQAIILVCWGMCFLLYGFVHCTYPKDRDHAREEAMRTRTR